MGDRRRETTRSGAWAAAAALALAVAACSSDASDGEGASSQPDHDPGSCGLDVVQHPLEPTAHVDECSAVTYGSNPPSSGNHYPNWAQFKAYDAPVPRGFWVHDLEHGAVVITYNCPDGCPSDVAAAKAAIDALPADPLCEGAGPKRRVLLTPDPLLDSRWAASSWGFTMKGSCFDAARFSSFYVDHSGKAPESVCADGQDVIALGKTIDTCGKLPAPTPRRVRARGGGARGASGWKPPLLRR